MDLDAFDGQLKAEVESRKESQIRCNGVAWRLVLAKSENSLWQLQSTVSEQLKLPGACNMRVVAEAATQDYLSRYGAAAGHGNAVPLQKSRSVLLWLQSPLSLLF